MGVWSASDANGNASQRIDRERRERLAKCQTKAANAAGRSKRKV